METITIPKNYDGHSYVVKCIPWVLREEIRIKYSRPIPGKELDFNDLGFEREMLRACVEKDGKPLTDEDVDALDSKSGEILDRAITLLNSLTGAERKNLGQMPTWTILKTL